MGAAALHPVRPDFGFEQHPQRGPELLQKALHRRRRVPRLPDLQIARAQQLGPFGAAGGGAVAEQQAQARHLLAQCRQQQGGGAGFAQRHGMHPNPAAGGLQARVVAKALLHVLQIARFGAAPAPVPPAHPGLQQPHQQAINGQRHALKQAQRWDKSVVALHTHRTAPPTPAASSTSFVLGARSGRIEQALIDAPDPGRLLRQREGAVHPLARRLPQPQRRLRVAQHLLHRLR